MSLVNTSSKYCQHWHTIPGGGFGSTFLSRGFVLSVLASYYSHG